VGRCDAAGKWRHNAIAIDNRVALVEHWTSAAGTPVSASTTTIRSHTWTQQWVGLGLLLKMSGGPRRCDGARRAAAVLSTGKVTRLRGTWSSLPDGRVRQHFEESFDEGHTWTEWFDGYYRRVAGSNSGPSMTAR
jgi:hypothetical protein